MISIAQAGPIANEQKTHTNQSALKPTIRINRSNWKIISDHKKGFKAIKLGDVDLYKTFDAAQTALQKATLPYGIHYNKVAHMQNWSADEAAKYLESLD